MRNLLGVLFVLGMLVPTGPNVATQHDPYKVQLHVVLNGQPAPLPKQVLVKNHRQSVTLPVVAGHILVPEEMAMEPTLTLYAHIGQDLITIPNIPRSGLDASWTIILADKTFGDYKYAFPKGTDVSSKCLLAFESGKGDGIVMKVRNCRRPLQEHPTDSP
jgi:hypothetical protein